MNIRKRLPKGYLLSYAQNREDIIIRAFFPDVKKGFYVDVGANHPVDDSVTNIFYKEGWNGINIEPNVDLYRLLRKQRPRDTNLNIGVSNKDTNLIFREYTNHGLSTLSQDAMAEHNKLQEEGTSSYADRSIRVLPLRTILKEHSKGETIRFMKIDVEGYEFEAIEGNNWRVFRPELVCVEANHIKRDWRQMMEAARYQLVFNDGINDYYLREESLARKQYFDYAKNVVLAGIIIGPGVAARIVQGEEDRFTAIEQAKRIKELEGAISSLSEKLASQQHKLRSKKYLLRKLVERIRQPR